MSSNPNHPSRMIGWAAVIFSLQNWLSETSEQSEKATSPGYISVGMSLMAIVVAGYPTLHDQRCLYSNCTP